MVWCTNVVDEVHPVCVGSDGGPCKCVVHSPGRLPTRHLLGVCQHTNRQHHVHESEPVRPTMTLRQRWRHLWTGHHWHKTVYHRPVQSEVCQHEVDKLTIYQCCWCHRRRAMLDSVYERSIMKGHVL